MKKILENKKGITLIALVITIIVLIILAGVIINLAVNKGLLGRTAETVFRTEIEKYNEQLKMSIVEDEINNLGVRIEKFNIRRNNYNDENTFVEEMKTKIPDFDEKYSNKLEIKEDELTYIGEDEKERLWLAKTINLAAILKISYVYENGTEAATTYKKVITEESYEVESPTIDGYVPDHFIVTGEIENDTNITVTYYPPTEGLEYIGLDESGKETDNEEDIVAYTVAGAGTFTGKNLIIPREYNGKEVTQIKNNAFQRNNNIKILIITNTVNKINLEAFEGMNKIEFLRVDAENIEKWAFSGCSFKEIEIGSNVKSISIGSISGGNLKYILVCSEIASITGYTTRDSSAFIEYKVNKNNNKYKAINGILYSKDGKTLYAYPQGKKDKKITIKNIDAIGSYAFHSCYNLNEVEILDTVGTTGYDCFWNCTNINKVFVNSKIIDSFTFEGNTNLKQIEIGTNVNNIKNCSFGGCRKVEEFKYLGTMQQWRSIYKYDLKAESNITEVLCTDGNITL